MRSIHQRRQIVGFAGFPAPHVRTNAFMIERDGVARMHGSWPDAEVFWQGAQRELLVADNQTRAYDDASPAVREAYARFAWGPQARPA